MVLLSSIVAGLVGEYKPSPSVESSCNPGIPSPPSSAEDASHTWPDFGWSADLQIRHTCANWQGSFLHGAPLFQL